MRKQYNIIPKTKIEQKIFLVRSRKVILDADLAALYGVETRRLNEQVKRNINRFPEDFAFQLSLEDVDNLKSQFAISSSGWGGRRNLPLREYLATHEELARKLSSLEKKYDTRFKVVFDALRRLMTPPGKPRRLIGF